MKVFRFVGRAGILTYCAANVPARFGSKYR